MLETILGTFMVISFLSPFFLMALIPWGIDVKKDVEEKEIEIIPIVMKRK